MCFFIFHFYFFLLFIQQFTAQQAVHLGNPSILSLWSALFCYPFPSFHPLRHIFSDPISWFQNQSGYFSEQTMMSSWQRDTLTGDDPQWECLFLAAVFSPDNCHIPYWRSFLSPFSPILQGQNCNSVSAKPGSKSRKPIPKTMRWTGIFNVSRKILPDFCHSDQVSKNEWVSRISNGVFKQTF